MENTLARIFAQGIREKEIFFFSSDRINTATPHFFVCIKRTDTEVLILSCCTSKPAASQRFISSRGLPPETLVHIPSQADDPSSPFPKDTYINCNGYIEHTVTELKSRFEEGRLTPAGSLPEKYYDLILKGLHISDQIDEHIKEILPNPA